MRGIFYFVACSSFVNSFILILCRSCARIHLWQAVLPNVLLGREKRCSLRWSYVSTSHTIFSWIIFWIFRIEEWISLVSFYRPLSQAVTRRFLIAESRVHFQGSPYGIYDIIDTCWGSDLLFVWIFHQCYKFVYKSPSKHVKVFIFRLYMTIKNIVNLL